MACREYVPALAGWIYDEISPAEAERLRAHLGRCAACREELERLRSAREALREAHAAVPAMPPILVLRARSLPGWVLAAALLGAGLLSVSAFLAGRGLGDGPLTAVRPPGGAPVEPSSAVSGRPEAAEAGSPLRARPATFPQGIVTREELDRQLALLERRWQELRRKEQEEILAEITGLEFRTAERFGETRDALRYVALASQPEISEQ